MVTIYKVVTFEAAHVLVNHPKCGVLHGHSYRVEVWITGKPVGQWAFVYDFGDVASYLRGYDHSEQPITISAEMLASNAAWYFRREKNVSKVVVRVWETVTSYAEAVAE